MKKVCLFDFAVKPTIGDYRIESFDPMSYFPKRRHRTLADLILGGVNACYYHRELAKGAEYVDRLYRERDPYYMRMVGDFIDKFKEHDMIVFLHYNFIHPEILKRELADPVKILGFVDDPLSTYIRGIPYLWAFDGAFYISPGYADSLPFEKAIKRWTNAPTAWWPLVPTPFQRPVDKDEGFFRNRTIDLTYVGNAYGPKIDRLIRLKKRFGDQFRVHGRWPFKGYHGFVRALQGKPVFTHRVTSLSNQERTELYWETKIGFNLHVSERPSETGNMRMYETPAHGMLMICDKAGDNAHVDIFEPGEEAVYYDTIEEAIELIEYYLHHEDERTRIAKAGFERYWRDYEWEKNLLRLLDWGIGLRK